MRRSKHIQFVILVSILLMALNTTYLFAQTPSFEHGGNQTVQQNIGTATQATISGWASNIIATTPQFNVSLPSLSGSIKFDINPTVDASSGDLTFTVTPNTSGEAFFNVLLEDLNNGLKSNASTIKITVEFINAAPTYTITSSSLVFNEKAGAVAVDLWAKNITAGPNPLEVTQNIKFITTIKSKTQYIDFNDLPDVDKFGNLTFEATDKSNGVFVLEIYLEDDGSDVPPNVNKSTPIEVTITINPINDAPTFLKGANIIIDEHSGPYSEPWATNVSAGAPDEDLTQTIDFILVQKEISGNIQFDTPPTIDSNGQISFEVTPHYNGYIIYELVLKDDGIGSPAPNANTSNIQAFTITVNYINDAPTYDRGDDITVEESDQISSYHNWATNISPGISPNEQDQELHFTVNFIQVSGTLAFLIAPQLSADGTLTFRTTEHTHGEAIFDVFLTDNGDLVLPHKNTSEVIQLKVTVTPVNFPPDDIFLSDNNILEKKAAGLEVGFFTTSDLDPEDSHNYALVAGDGSEGNEFFAIEGDKLVTTTSFSWEEAEIHTIRVKSSDGEFSIEKNFDINIIKVVEGIKFANAITPNGDGNNDTWAIEDIDAFPDALVHIYDKAGLTVYKSSGGYNAWEGTTLGGKILPMGTYYYIIDLRNGSPIYQGTLTIIL